MRPRCCGRSHPDRYEITLSDVPIDTRVSFRVNDQNSCDLNPTGAVVRNVFANGVELVQNTLTPGSGDEPGYASHGLEQRPGQPVEATQDPTASRASARASHPPLQG